MFEEFNDPSLGGINKMNEMFEIESIKTITEKIVNNDAYFINYLLGSVILYPKTINLLNKAIEYYKLEENYEVCGQINNVKEVILSRQTENV